MAKIVDSRALARMRQEAAYRQSKPHQDVQHFVQGEDIQSDLLYPTTDEETLAVEDLVIMTRVKYDELEEKAGWQ